MSVASTLPVLTGSAAQKASTAGQSCLRPELPPSHLHLIASFEFVCDCVRDQVGLTQRLSLNLAPIGTSIGLWMVRITVSVPSA